MPKYLVFTSNNARFVNVDEGAANLLRGHTIIREPDLSAVAGVPPHYWEPGGGNKVLPMGPDERVKRDADIALNGADCVVSEALIAEPKRRRAYTLSELLWSSGLFGAMLFLLEHFLKI